MRLSSSGSIFGWSDTFSAQLHAGNKYQKLKPVFCIVITEFEIFGKVDGVHLIFELRERNHPNVVLSDHLQLHFLRLFELLHGRFEVLDEVSPELRHWLNFLAFGGMKEDKEMSQLVENDPLVMEAVAELQRFSSDPDMRELERRRKLWKLEYYSGIEAAREEGEAKGLAEGREEGLAEGEAKAIITVLSARFKKVPKEITDRVMATTDLVVLESLTGLAATCDSLDEFRRALK